MTSSVPQGEQRWPAVPFCAFRCPACNAAKPHTYGSHGPIRYHRCRRCQAQFRSHELDPKQLAAWDSIRVADTNPGAGAPDSTVLQPRKPLVPFCPIRCPGCNACKPVTYGSTGRMRYHRCSSCGAKFRSLEMQLGEVGAGATTRTDRQAAPSRFDVHLRPEPPAPAATRSKPPLRLGGAVGAGRTEPPRLRQAAREVAPARNVGDLAKPPARPPGTIAPATPATTGPTGSSHSLPQVTATEVLPTQAVRPNRDR